MTITAHDPSPSFGTLLQHQGHTHRVGHGLIGATENAVTFTTPRTEDAPVYSRLGNTANHLELQELLAKLHGAESAIATGSGMAAMTLATFTLLRPGDHVLAQENCYGGNYNFLTKVLANWGIEVTFAAISDWPNLRQPQTKLCYFESITNPFCIPQDIGFVAKFAKEHNILSLCDNTFASPVLCQPLAHGIDLVLESATKYLNGHSDVISGMITGSAPLIQKMLPIHAYLGTFLPTPQCTMLLRGLRTLHLRMAAHNINGAKFAQSMNQSNHIHKVFYGMSANSPVARFFPTGFGGMVTLQFKESVNVKAMLASLKLVNNVPSLGGTESTATMPSYTTNWFMSPSEKARLGIDDQLVRFSIGLENVDDIIHDISASAAICSN